MLPWRTCYAQTLNLSHRYFGLRFSFYWRPNSDIGPLNPRACSVIARDGNPFRYPAAIYSCQLLLIFLTYLYFQLGLKMQSHLHGFLLQSVLRCRRYDHIFIHDGVKTRQTSLRCARNLDHFQIILKLLMRLVFIKSLNKFKFSKLKKRLN